MAAPGQLPLFAPEPVGPAAVEQAEARVARALPGGVHLGTSSWSFPGWRGFVYDRRATAGELAREGLAAYARHPLLRGVGLDRTFYAPLPADAFRAYAEQVPEGFRFLVKAHEACTWARFPSRPGYRAGVGADAGAENPLFLEPGHARDQVVGPCAEGLGKRLGVIVFQFPPQASAAVGGPERFAERLGRFLGALPRGVLYAAEIRNADWLTPDYAAALRSAGAVHCGTVHPRMPGLERQAEVAVGPDDPAVVVRWMLGGGRSYEGARQRYGAFDRLVDPDPPARSAVARLCAAAARRGRPAYVSVNNKAEGSAPRSVFALARAVVELAGGDA